MKKRICFLVSIITLITTLAACNAASNLLDSDGNICIVEDCTDKKTDKDVAAKYRDYCNYHALAYELQDFGSDEDTTQNPDNSTTIDNAIIGTWKSETYDEKYEEYIIRSITLSDDGTYTSMGLFGYGTYKTTGNQLIMTTSSKQVLTWNYDINNNQLTLSNEDESVIIYERIE